MLKSANKSLYSELEETRKARKELENKYSEAKKVVKALKQEVTFNPNADPNPIPKITRTLTLTT